MKIFKILLIGLGALSIFICLIMFTDALRARERESVWCDGVSEAKKELDDALVDYEKAKAGGKTGSDLVKYETTFKAKSEIFETKDETCANAKVLTKRTQTISILLGVTGILMLGIGLILKRREAMS